MRGPTGSNDPRCYATKRSALVQIVDISNGISIRRQSPAVKTSREVDFHVILFQSGHVSVTHISLPQVATTRWTVRVQVAAAATLVVVAVVADRCPALIEDDLSLSTRFSLILTISTF